jgi:RHS repeat-associated protein
MPAIRLCASISILFCAVLVAALANSATAVAKTPKGPEQGSLGIAKPRAGNFPAAPERILDCSVGGIRPALPTKPVVSCPRLPKRVTPWLLRAGRRTTLDLADARQSSLMTLSETGNELDVLDAISSSAFVTPFFGECPATVPFRGSIYSACGNVTFYDANWETSTKAPDTNFAEAAEYDACGKLVSSGKVVGWHVLETTYTKAGWHPAHNARVPLNKPYPCLGTWTMIYIWSQTFSNKETLEDGVIAPFLVTETEIPANATWGGGNPSELSCSQTCHGDPVNTATGDYYETNTDIEISGRGPGLEMTRTYSSLAASSKKGSILGRGWAFLYGMSLDVGPEVATVINENGSRTLFEAGPSGYTTSPNVLATLEENENETYTYTIKDRTSYDFDSAGRLIGITDRNGNATTLSYDEAGLLEKAEDDAGRSLEFAYDEETGKLVSAEDSTGRDVSYGYSPAGDLDEVTDVRGVTTKYTYDEEGLLLTRVDGRENTALTNTYNPFGQVMSQEDANEDKTTFKYLRTGSTTWREVKDPQGVITEYEYENGVLEKRVVAANTALKATWSFDHDPATHAITAVTDPDGGTSHATYDSRGNQTSTEDPSGDTTESVYDSEDNLIEYTNAEGVTTTYTYDANGNRLSESTPLLGSEPAVERTVTFVREDEAHPDDVTAIVDPRGKETEMTYDVYGNMTSVTDPLGNMTTYGYDALGRVETVTQPRGNVEEAEPADFTTTFSYDPAGNILSRVDPLGNESKWAYDPNGNVESATDANGHTTTYEYDAMNRRIRVEHPNEQTEETAYDSNGNVTAQIDGKSSEYTYTYTDRNELETSTDPLGRTTEYRYYTDGDLRLLIDPQERTTFFAYNEADELIEVEDEDGGTPNTTFEYDDVGRRLAMTDATGESSFEYDSLGRLIGTSDGHGNTISYDHDLAGNITGIEYPNGKEVTREFDDAGRMVGITDWLGKTTSFSYDPDSNLTDKVFPEATDIVDELSYDRAGRLSGVEVTQEASSLASLAYVRDDLGQVESLISKGLPGGETESFEYDPDNRLLDAGAESFEYDAANNLTAAPGTVNAYDPAGQLKSGTGTQYRYNALGERVEAGSGTAAYSSAFGSPGSGNGEFEHPAGIATDSEGDVWVVDQENNRVQQFSPEGEYISSFGTAGEGNGELLEPSDIAIDGNGHLWVADSGNNRIQEFNQAGEYLDQFGTTGEELSQLRYPESVAVDSEGDVWVADTANGRLQEFDAEGNPIQIVGEPGWEPGQIIEASGVAVGPDDHVWLADYSNSRVSEFDQEGELLTEFGEWGPGKGEFEGVGALDVDAAGNIWVADEGAGKVKKFDDEGEFLGEFGSPGTEEGEFSFGWRLGLAVDGQSIWVADTEANRVQRWLVPAETTPATSYEYDQLGNLTSVERPEGPESPEIDESYAYDGVGLRASQTVSASTSYLAWDQSGELPKLLSDGQKSYIYGPDGMPIEHISGEAATYYHQDNIGSTRMLTDASGEVTATFSYAAYGALANRTGSEETPLGYAGQLTNEQSGLQYMRARVYDPRTGQFLTRDPLFWETSMPYLYADGNPINNVDPSGEFIFDALGEALCGPLYPHGPQSPLCITGDEVSDTLGGVVDGSLEVPLSGIGPIPEWSAGPYLRDLVDWEVDECSPNYQWARDIAGGIRTASGARRVLRLGSRAADKVGEVAREWSRTLDERIVHVSKDW